MKAQGEVLGLGFRVQGLGFRVSALFVFVVWQEVTAGVFLGYAILMIDQNPCIFHESHTK